MNIIKSSQEVKYHKYILVWLNCPFYQDNQVSIKFYYWGLECCPLYGVSSGCPLFRGCFIIEVNGVTIGTSVSVRYIVGVRHSGVVVKRVSTVYTHRLPE